MIYSVYATKSTPDQMKVSKKCIDYIKQTTIAFYGACIVKAGSSEFFGGEDSRDFQSKVLINPTYRKLFGVSKQQRKATKDDHHIFFEGIFDTGKDVEVKGQNVRVLELLLGS